MNFYEDLGVAPDASPESIREAYRNLARLLHPDAQTDPVLKGPAEAQMKRVNHIYKTLKDPAKRHRYDLKLSETVERPGRIIAATPEPVRVPAGAIAWLAAAVICATFIIWLATRESSTPVVYPLPSALNRNSGPPGMPAASLQARLSGSAADSFRDNEIAEIARLRTELAEANADRERLTRQVISLTRSEPGYREMEKHPQAPPDRTAPPMSQSVSVTPVPPLAPSSGLQIALPSPISGAVLLPSKTEPAARPEESSISASDAQDMRWTGSWSYVRQPPGSKDKPLFPPEFIETSMTTVKGRIHGDYRARFKVSTRDIRPDVVFHFEGRVYGPAGHFHWTGPGGSKGEVNVRLVSGTGLEVAWAATKLGSSMGLASGTAVLNRKN